MDLKPWDSRDVVKTLVPYFVVRCLLEKAVSAVLCGILACSGYAHMVMLFKYVFLKIGVLLTSSRAWTDGFWDVMLLFWTNVGVKDETSGRFHRAELGVAPKSAEGAPLSFKAGSALCRAIPLPCHSSGQCSTCGSVSAVGSTSKETGFSKIWLACCRLSPFQ